MPVYTVSYDLIKETEHDYERLWDELERLDAHRTQESYWLVNYSGTASELKDLIFQYMHARDRLWVVRVHPNRKNSEEYDYKNAIAGTNAWLKKYPPT